MLTRFIVSAAVLAAVFSAPLPARAAQPDVTVDLPAQACTSGIRGEVCHHVFEKQKVHVRIAAVPLPVKKGACPKPSVELLQLSTRLEAPVPGAVTPAGGDLCAGGDFAVEFPALANETEFEVVFSRDDGNGRGEPLGAAGFKAYPHSLLDAMKSWAADKNDALVLRDADGRLADFLERSKVDFLPRDTTAPGVRKITLAVLPDPDKNPGSEAPKVSGDAVYIHEKIDTLPLVTVDHAPDHTTVDVQLKLLDALAADDPLAEKMLAEIFNKIAK